MTLEDSVFQKVKINRDKMRSFGFREDDGVFVYETDFCDGDFRAILKVDENSHLTGTVLENDTGDEYLSLRIKDATGAFVFRVREAYLSLLKSIAVRIGTPVPFCSDQANRITMKIIERYGETPDFSWRGEAGDDADNGVFRHKDNEKWYGLIMHTALSNLKTDAEKAEAKKQAEAEKKKRAEERKRREEAKKAGKKLPPMKKRKKQVLGEEEQIDIINLKIRTEDREEILREEGIFPAFHMNARYWISVRLDDTLPDERIMELVDNSYRMTAKGAGRNQRADGRKVWIVPANPKYYDIVGVFSQTDDTIWKQGKGIRTGDIVYMYVAVPYSAILYRCTVTQAHSASENGMELMDLHIDERYNPKLCTLEKMKKFHVTTVRGPRFMPMELENFIQRNK